MPAHVCAYVIGLGLQESWIELHALSLATGFSPSLQPLRGPKKSGFCRHVSLWMLQRPTGLQPNSISQIEVPKRRQAGILFTLFFRIKTHCHAARKDRCHTWCISVTSVMRLKENAAV